MFQRILIANRGEIACRIAVTCKKLGIETVAVFSTVDRTAKHVREADMAIALRGAAPSESYLDIEQIITAAQESNAEAIHPGYGFLAENDAFVRACNKADIVFIGPQAETIAEMGSKAEAKRLMESAGVPVVPGYHGEDQDNGKLQDEANRIGYPLMLKPAAGGGGKGMRIVRSEQEFSEKLESARREAKNAFGDERMILERYVESPRHIEFQVFGDNAGNVIHLNERDCSVQRRYQKIIEETPSPFLDRKTRAAMGKTAVEAARAVDYLGAGTVEFIVGADKQFYFMEMNTRLQVEHPVTEMVTGLDLVEWQLRIATGESLPLRQEQIESNGHAVEARVYAESPEKGFLPSSGRIDALRFPAANKRLRIDAGVSEGDDVSIHYDPLLAKLIVSGPDRAKALARLQQSLAQSYIGGLDTNLDFLIRLSHLDKFEDGEIDTAYLDRCLEEVLQHDADTPIEAFIAVALQHVLSIRKTGNPIYDPQSPWGLADNWRAGAQAMHELLIRSGDDTITITCSASRGHYRLRVKDQEIDITQAQLTDNGVAFLRAGRRTTVSLLLLDDGYRVNYGGARWHLTVVDPLARAASRDADEHHVNAPMPGRVIAVKAKAGDEVSAGQELIVIEAMKMEISLRAPHDGKIAALLHNEGDFVSADEALVELE